MSEENVEIVRGIYAEWARGNMRAGTELFDPDIVFESFMPDANERVVVRGPVEIARFMGAFLRQWRDYRLVADELRDEGEIVYVSGYQSAAGRHSGIAVEDTIFSVWTLRDGRIVRLIFDRDRQRALEAAGLSE